MTSKSLRAHIKRIGLQAGTLGHFSSSKANAKIDVSLVDYSPGAFVEKKDASIKDCLACLNNPSITWVNICGIHDPHMIEEVGKKFGLHPLMLEDIMSLGQRSKLDDYKETLYIVARMLTYDSKKEVASDEQVSLILGKNYVITFLESNSPIFNPIRERLKQADSRIRQRGADYLYYALIDCLVDNYFVILEKVDGKLEHLEGELFDHPGVETLQTIHQIKREITFLRKSIWPMREVISNFRRIDSPLVQDSTKLYVQDVYDHTIQAIDTIESFRDLTSGMLEIYISNISQRMNEIMKVLTIMATLFVPLTFIASIYGMNFEHIPGLHWEWGYFSVMGFMLILSIGMLAYFRRKGWI